jgi:hypothetical protein
MCNKTSNDCMFCIICIQTLAQALGVLYTVCTVTTHNNKWQALNGL